DVHTVRHGRRPADSWLVRTALRESPEEIFSSEAARTAPNCRGQRRANEAGLQCGRSGPLQDAALRRSTSPRETSRADRRRTRGNLRVPVFSTACAPPPAPWCPREA